ncbi:MULTISPECIES: FAD-dependent oxidoreductase [Aerococcus]|uniref:FAD-dependent oxidoreductase n=1 Tax=Aerococcus TaxID=1375 RepID=UPI000DCF2998|nr:FAD-dependent oxidoreductase [Aerococcus urinae]RAV94309.1 FAD-binding dehydrogenase [Aerococcus mictus]MDK6375295.1 FAD-dependent oxidoreductase [Aerococcus urinae]MDK6420143.1 FAD-dependent oxidoreductase [Aerococcus urinae]MDK8075636.1 FAD-dependent oxidoreductase [Aerococcus urinae]MDK8084595.1 FAD-dependent oxidoreductase [Aerococcus urinae]
MDYEKWSSQLDKIDETIDTELLIVGSGISGLAAAVQGAQEGLKVTVIEKNGFIGGNGVGVEGMLGVGSNMQKDAGISFEPIDVIQNEHSQAQYAADGSLWIELIYNSAENIEWCLEQGVEYEKVDDYHGTCSLPTFHWFKGGFASIGYVPQMSEKAKELGVEILLEHSAYSVIYEDGKVKGAYVKNKDKNIKINAEAVILSTGGIGGDIELVGLSGIKTENTLLTGMPGSTGDGYKISRAVGGKDMLRENCALLMNYIQAFPHKMAKLYLDPLNGMMGVPAGGPFLWVNQEGDRFVNENVKKVNMMYQSMAVNSNKASYTVFNQAIFDEFTKDIEDAKDVLAESVKTNEGDSLYKADTLEELAEKVGIPAEEFVKTVKHYNELAHDKHDKDFGKEEEFLVPIEEGPYYIARLDLNYVVGIGGIATNKRFEVINEDFEKIPGLYSTGMDAAPQYRHVYTINMGGSACAHNVNSGRTAAKSASRYINQ